MVAVGLAAEPVDFGRDIQPLLSDLCYHCHGPDATKREAKLRLDTKDGAFAKRDGHAALVPGKPEQSELYRRITATDPDERMPPPDFERKLTTKQIETMRRWIEQGAPWQQHWAFVPPQRPVLPPVRRGDWPRNAIDFFVLNRLDRESLTPSAEAERTTLIRRVTLDLTGLPPTPAEVESFVADRSPDAYERLVERLLSSPRFGERFAGPWLDAARYADTSGYQSDGPRYMWRWRDWVIDAFNRNQPFDQFTIEQLAGDLLPRPTLDQRIATGFNRNHRGNSEGGIVPEEYAVEYVVDRVETTGTVWLGLTLGCTRCHEHKYDPFSQKDFYRLFAYFNNVPEFGRAIKEGNSPPYITAPTPQQQEQLERLKSELLRTGRQIESKEGEFRAAQTQWEQTATRDVDTWRHTDGLVSRFGLDSSPESAKLIGDEPKFVLGPFANGQATAFHGKSHFECGDIGNFQYTDKFSLAVWVRADESNGTLLSRMTPEPEADGYYLQLVNGKLQLNLVKRWLDDALRVETESSLPLGDWHHVAITYDGSKLARGVRIYVDGQRQKLKVNLDLLNQTFAVKEPFRIGGGASRWHGSLADVCIYDRDLTTAEVETLAERVSLSEILSMPVAKRTSSQKSKVQAAFLNSFAPESLRGLYAQFIRQQREIRKFKEQLPTVMVMEEMPQPRTTHVLKRGEYDKLGEPVSPGVPPSLPPLPAGAEPNRLGLARWLVSPENPLPARVTVNRFWQMYFGTGLVKTTEDFGSQGERPSHPELLDWLATEFIASGWDVKALQRLIVTSATYRQSSRVPKALVDRDPENRLLARGPRFRLSAELIRDQALAASGQLVERLGGPSVNPYQPAGLWKEIATVTEYQQSTGADLYRRSLYTFWKRTVAPPTMTNFDATARETCIVRPTRTNTPLQALTLMNDVTYVEAARLLAERVLAAQATSPTDRIRQAFFSVVSREPSPAESRLLLAALNDLRQRFVSHPDSARKLIRIGDSTPAPQIDPVELAAYTSVCSLILNLDEAVTKE